MDFPRLYRDWLAIPQHMKQEIAGHASREVFQSVSANKMSEGINGTVGGFQCFGQKIKRT